MRGRIIPDLGNVRIASPLPADQAIVGAYVLAGEVWQAGRHYIEALQRYEQLMRPYASRGQNGGRTFARVFAPGSRTTFWLRNRILGRGLILRLAAQRADSFVLPDYFP